jgi:acetylglutamate kinase
MGTTTNNDGANHNSFLGRLENVYVIKIGGNIIDDEAKLSSFLQSFASLEGKKILVHGGGKLATKLADHIGVPQHMIEGRRITDKETLKVVTMVYAGYINKNIIALLQSNGCNAMGLCGADGNLLQAHKRQHATIDYGFVGDIDMVNTELLKTLLDQDITVVVAPITHDAKGTLLNTNADTVAQEIAATLGKIYQIALIYTLEKNGVLLNVDDENSVIPRLTRSYYDALKNKQFISDGMLPKLDNAFAALEKGVYKVIVGKAEQLQELITGNAGTTIHHE